MILGNTEESQLWPQHRASSDSRKLDVSLGSSLEFGFFLIVFSFNLVLLLLLTVILYKSFHISQNFLFSSFLIVQ